MCFGLDKKYFRLESTLSPFYMDHFLAQRNESIRPKHDWFACLPISFEFSLHALELVRNDQQ